MSWIKMRTSLATHPKVVRMASALKADRLRVIGGLHAVWCLFDAHTENGILSGYSVSVVDELIGWPGFAAAMVAENWLVESDGALSVRDFESHNGQSAKRRAMEADRKREARKTSAPPSASDADNDADKPPTKSGPEKEKEKEKEKNKEPKTKAPPAALPDWLPLDSWNGYLEMRKRIKKVPTDHAISLLLKALAAMRESGQDIAAVLDKSTMNNWTNVYPIRDERRAGDRRAPEGDRRLNRQEQLEANNMAIADALAERLGLNNLPEEPT